MLIIQVEREVYFMGIKKLERLSMLSKDYCFYERNKKLKENHKLKKGIHYIQYIFRLKGGGKTKWYKWFDTAYFNKEMNKSLNDIEWIKNQQKSREQIKYKWISITAISGLIESIIKGMEKLPEDADKRQKNFYKDNKIMERIMEAVCDDVKETKEVKKEANGIIKEIARKAESPWKTEYFEDKNDPWEYKISY
jgi:hypothetical protein